MAERGVASRSRSKSQINRRVSKKGICIYVFTYGFLLHRT
jgi:hypothetical protein